MRLRLSIRFQFYLLLTVLMASVSVMGLSPLFVGPIFALMVLQPLLHFLRHRKFSIFYRTGVRETLLLMLAYMLLSIAWGIEQKQAVQAWSWMLALFFGGCLVFESVAQLNHHHKQTLADALVSGVGLGLVIVGLEIYTGGFFTAALNAWSVTRIDLAVRLEYASYVLSLLIWPVLAYFLMKGKTRMAIAVAVAVMLMLLKIGHAPAIYTLISGALLMALAYAMPRMAVAVFIAGWTALIAGVPVYMAQLDADKFVQEQKEVLPEEEHTSLDAYYVWEMTAKKALENDPMGVGFKNTQHVKLKKKEILTPYPEADTLPLPANGIAQLWLELGFIGLFWAWLLMIVVVFSLRRSVRSSPMSQMAAMGMGVALVIPPLFFVSVWNMAWLMLAVFAILSFHICVNAGARNVI